jgi:HlyD family secretion protein
MVFEGKVDEGEVGKLKVGMPLVVSLGAISDKEFDARLRFIAPKGVEESGAVKFKIEGDVTVEDDFTIRAGYSANASLILDRKEDILVMPEALLQFDKVTDEPYVEVEVGEQKFERRDIKIGISDGINVEILEGLTESDKVKQWNKTEPIKIESEEAPNRGV